MDTVTLLVLLLIAVVFVVGTLIFVSRREQQPSNSNNTQPTGQTTSQQSQTQYTGRPMYDPILRKRHELIENEKKVWSLDDVSKHNKMNDLFVIVSGCVYDVSDFVDEHPGGIEAIMRSPGGDITVMFNGPQHPEKAQQMIGEYYVGDLDNKVDSTEAQVVSQDNIQQAADKQAEEHQQQQQQQQEPEEQSNNATEREKQIKRRSRKE